MDVIQTIFFLCVYIYNLTNCKLLYQLYGVAYICTYFVCYILIGLFLLDAPHRDTYRWMGNDQIWCKRHGV